MSIRTTNLRPSNSSFEIESPQERPEAKLPNVLQRLRDLQEAGGALKQMIRGGVIGGHTDHSDCHTDNHRDRP